MCAPTARATARSSPGSPESARPRGRRRAARRAPSSRARRERGRRLVPEERDLVGVHARVESGRLELGSDVLGAREVDEEKGRELADVGRRGALGFDADRARDDVRVALAQEPDMVDAVEERDHDRLAHLLRRREGERSLQRRRLRRHPEDVDGAFEPRRRRHVDLEIAEHDALDEQPAAVARERFRPHDQDDVGARPRERAADQAADPADAEDRMSHARIVSAPPTRARAARRRPLPSSGATGRSTTARGRRRAPGGAPASTGPRRCRGRSASGSRRRSRRRWR